MPSECARVPFATLISLVSDPTSSALTAGACFRRTTERRCSIRHQPGDNDQSDHAHQVTRVVLLDTKDSRSHSADAFGIADHVKLDDLVIDDSERHDAVWLPIERDDYTGGTVDQRWNEHRRRIGAEARLTSDSRCTADDDGRSSAARPEVGPQHDVRVEHCDQRVEVTTRELPRRRHRQLCVDERGRNPVFRRPSPTSRPAGELPGRRRASIHHRSDLLEWQVEHVMENEGQGAQRQ